MVHAYHRLQRPHDPFIWTIYGARHSLASPSCRRSSLLTAHCSSRVLFKILGYVPLQNVISRCVFETCALNFRERLIERRETVAIPTTKFCKNYAAHIHGQTAAKFPLSEKKKKTNNNSSLCMLDICECAGDVFVCVQRIFNLVRCASW